MKLIDISVLIGADIPVWEGDTHPILNPESKVYDRGVIQTTTITMNVHTGTHIDAPRHLYPDGGEAPDIPLKILNGSCQVIEVDSHKQLITKEDLNSAGFVTGYKRVLIKSPNSELWEQEGKRFCKDYVALDKTAAQYLVRTGVSLVGIDYLSIAPFSNVWDVHQTLLSNQVVILEGLNLKNVGPGYYDLLCFPLKLDSKDGLPVRAVLKK